MLLGNPFLAVIFLYLPVNTLGDIHNSQIGMASASRLAQRLHNLDEMWIIALDIPTVEQTLPG